MTGVPPALRYRVRELVGLLPKSGELEGFAGDRLERLLADGEPWLGADPTLAAVGYWMIDAARGPELRPRGRLWRTMVPSGDTAARLAPGALAPQTPAPGRGQAKW